MQNLEIMRNTEENNKLIAEFMGKEIFQLHHESFYHASWGWLMPVVSKCWEVAREEDIDFPEMLFERGFEYVTTVDIEKSYKAVVNFIKKESNKPSLEAVTEVAIGVTDDLVDKIFTDVMSEFNCKNGDTSMEEQEKAQELKMELAALVAKITHENL